MSSPRKIIRNPAPPQPQRTRYDPETLRVIIDAVEAHEAYRVAKEEDEKRDSLWSRRDLDAARERWNEVRRRAGYPEVW